MPPTQLNDVISRTALRYSLSEREYTLLQKYLISRLPRSVAKRVPDYPTSNGNTNDADTTTLRTTLRIFLSTYLSLRTADAILPLLTKTPHPPPPPNKKPPFRIARISLSLSLLLLLHRALYRFLGRLRAALLSPEAKGFRKRNPKAVKVLGARLAPAVGAGLAGATLGIWPGGAGRRALAVWIISKAGEGVWRWIEGRGWVGWRPWWYGSWLLLPLASGQLFHAFVFDRDCFPAAYGNFILRHSPAYIQPRPVDYPSHLPWPGAYDIVDGLVNMAELNHPPFISPILFPNNKHPLPPSLTAISPITDPAHPLIKHLTCALFHPNDPSCTRTYITYWIQAFPSLARVMALALTLLSLPRLRRSLINIDNDDDDENGPFRVLASLTRSILRSSLILTGGIGTAWASICLFVHLFPRTFLPKRRFFLSGVLGGLFAFLARKDGRNVFLYSARTSVESAWLVGVKRGWIRGVRGGDVWVFCLGLAVLGAVWEGREEEVGGGVVGWWMRELKGGKCIGKERGREGKRGEGFKEE